MHDVKPRWDLRCKIYCSTFDEIIGMNPSELELEPT